MQLLFVSWWWPYPAVNGSKIRIYNLLRQLAEQHQVILLSFAESGEATAEHIAHLREFCQQVEVVDKPVYDFNSLKATLGYMSRWPRHLIDVYSGQMAALVAQYAPGCDLVIVSQLQTLRYLSRIGSTPGLLEEIEISSFYNQVAQASSVTSRFRGQLTLRKVEIALRSLLDSGVAMTVVSELERDCVQRLGSGAPVEVIPNGVDTTDKHPDSAVQPKAFSLIYTGAVTYGPNYDAVDFFIREVLPLVRQRYPETSFSVTGGTGQVDVSDLAAQPGVHFTGYLPEIDPAIHASWLTVVPLRAGGGTRLKILESMALGTPVVSTHKGAEGLHVTDGENILLADEPEAMAAQVCALLADPARREQVAQAGRALVQTEYDWVIIGRQLADFIERIVRKAVMNA